MVEVRCWRCDRKLFEVHAETLPADVVIEEKCGGCKAKNRIPLDRLKPSAVA